MALEGWALADVNVGGFQAIRCKAPLSGLMLSAKGDNDARLQAF